MEILYQSTGQLNGKNPFGATMSKLLILRAHQALPMTGSRGITKVDNHDNPDQNPLV